MICHVKFILAWILLLPRLSGNVFYCDFVLFCVYFLPSSLNLVHQPNVLHLDDFYIDSNC